MTLLNTQHRKYILLAVLVSLLFTSCSSKQFTHVDHAKDVFYVNLEIDSVVPEPMRKEITTAFNDFTIYSKGRSVRFIDAQGKDDADIILHVYSFRQVTSAQSTAGVFVSLIGFATPIMMAVSGAPIVITFWYFPKSQSVAEITTTNAMAGQPARRMYRILAPGFLKSPDKQYVKHGQAYRDFFVSMSRFYERDLLKASKKSNINAKR